MSLQALATLLPGILTLLYFLIKYLVFFPTRGSPDNDEVQTGTQGGNGNPGEQPDPMVGQSPARSSYFTECTSDLSHSSPTGQSTSSSSLHHLSTAILPSLSPQKYRRKYKNVMPLGMKMRHGAALAIATNDHRAYKPNPSYVRSYLTNRRRNHGALSTISESYELLQSSKQHGPLHSSSTICTAGSASVYALPPPFSVAPLPVNPLQAPLRKTHPSRASQSHPPSHLAINANDNDDTDRTLFDSDDDHKSIDPLAPNAANLIVQTASKLLDRVLLHSRLPSSTQPRRTPKRKLAFLARIDQYRTILRKKYSQRKCRLKSHSKGSARATHSPSHWNLWNK